ncbi:MAG: major capsid family protein [Cetobacterium sp.]|uniref:major capsid family protein n=1 Tax=Cetobacterium sp. TaxID=2071632 RepID=UPI003EE5F5BC
MKNIPRANAGLATNPVRDVLSASMIDAITERRVKLVLSGMIPRITDVDGLDISAKHIKYNREVFDGKSLITTHRPNTVPTTVIDSEPCEAKIFWNTHGIRITAEDRALFSSGKTKFENKSLTAMRLMAEGENKILKDGIAELGGIGLDTAEGINIVPSSAKWNTLTGEQILEEIRIAKSAHVAGGKFTSDEMWLDDYLYELLEKPYSSTEPKTILTLLNERKWFNKIVSIPEYGTATIKENNSSVFGYVEDMSIQMTDEYQEGRDDVYFVEQHISEILILQPMGITKIEGAK